QEGAIKMYGEQPLPFCKRKVHKGMDDLNAGIADKDVDLAFRNGISDSFLDLRLIGHVHRHREGVSLARLDFRGSGFRCLEIEVCDHRDAALGREADCDLLADATGGTGDDCHSSIEACHDHLLLLLSPPTAAYASFK